MSELNRTTEITDYSRSPRKGSKSSPSSRLKQKSISEQLEVIRALGFKRDKQIEQISINAEREHRRTEEISK